MHSPGNLVVLITGLGKKQRVTMASKRLKTDDDWTGRRIDFSAFSRALSERRAELAIVDPADPERIAGRNPGKSRTASKRALLKAIEDAGGKW